MREQRPDLFISEGVEQVISILKDIYPDQDIRMVALYGSAAKGNFVCGVSDINLFIVVKRETLSQIRDWANQFGAVTQQYRIRATVMTEKELEQSADIFPVEYLEIRETMRLIYGEDLFSTLRIDRSQYRHQLEERLRGSVTALRQLVILFGGRKKLMHEYLLNWCGKQDTVFRALIRIKDESRLKDAGNEAGPKVAEIVSELYHEPVEVLRLVYLYRDDPKNVPIQLDDIIDLLASYERLTDAVDAM